MVAWARFINYCSILEWRHNGRDGVSNHQPHHCLLNRLFRRRSKKISKLRVTGLCADNSLVNGEFPVQMASNAENVSVDDVIMMIKIRIQWNFGLSFYSWSSDHSNILQIRQQRSCYVMWKIIEAIALPELTWKQTEYSLAFELWRKTSVKWVPGTISFTTPKVANSRCSLWFFGIG